MEAVLCSGCGKSISGGDVLYTNQGNPICSPCNANAEIAQLDVRAGGNIKKAAATSLGLAILGWFFNPFFLVTVVAVSSAVYALNSLAPANERFARHVRASRGTIVGLAIAALAITGLFMIRVILSLIVAARS